MQIIKQDASLQQKRTLKEIYKLLKRDIKSMTIRQEKQGQQQQNADYDGFSSNSSSSDEDDDGDRCEDDGEQSMGYDDLTPGELEELQGDIIKAIENFDSLFNSSKHKTNKNGKYKKTAPAYDKDSRTNESSICNLNGKQKQLKDLSLPIAYSQSQYPQIESLKKAKPSQQYNNSAIIANYNFSNALSANQKRNSKKSVAQINYANYILAEGNNTGSKQEKLGTLYGQKIGGMSCFKQNNIQESDTKNKKQKISRSD